MFLILVINKVCIFIKMSGSCTISWVRMMKQKKFIISEWMWGFKVICQKLTLSQRNPTCPLLSLPSGSWPLWSRRAIPLPPPSLTCCLEKESCLGGDNGVRQPLVRIWNTDSADWAFLFLCSVDTGSPTFSLLGGWFLSRDILQGNHQFSFVLREGRGLQWWCLWREEQSR